MAGQPNALPLFQYALTELFDARDGAVLDLATYERIGGVRKAVARRAESLYSQLDRPSRRRARQLFLRIATVSGDVVGRRRVPASELVSLDVDIVALQRGDRRVRRATGSWPSTATRRRAARPSRSPTRRCSPSGTGCATGSTSTATTSTKQASFLVAVNEWEASGRDPGYLLTGSRLERLRDVGGRDDRLRLTATEHDFIAAAVAAREAEVAADTATRGPATQAAPPVAAARAAALRCRRVSPPA